MKKKLSILLILYSCSIFSQEKKICGTNDRLEIYQRSNTEYANKFELLEKNIQKWIDINTKSNSITIPVVVHVIYKNNSENISDAQIHSQIEALNKDFRRMNNDANNTPSDFLPVSADMQIEFCLAKRYLGNPTNGIVRRQTNHDNFQLYSDSVFYTSDGGSNAWNTSRYLNIWVCNIAGNVMGWAQFPNAGNTQTDGIVIDYERFGTTGTVSYPYDLGRTTTHEVGHWLNLLHIWGDATCGDDYVNDTPIQEQANFGCNIHPKPSCTNNGDMFMNFMDYSDDYCMNLFTQGQKNRVMATINTYRSSLISSNGCQPYTLQNTDAGIYAIINPNITDVECSKPLYPKVIIKNYGTDTLFVATIKYNINGGTYHYQVWNGVLKQNEKDTILLSGIDANNTSNTLFVSSIYPNNSTDINIQNDSKTINFNSINGNKISIKLITDNYGYETSWRLYNNSWNIIDMDDSLLSNKIYKQEYCLEDGCYSFVIYDTYGDGFCCNYGNGSFVIENLSNNNKIAQSAHFSFSDTSYFCINTTSIINKDDIQIEIFPNPNDGIFYINYMNYSKNIPNYAKIYDQLGRLIKEVEFFESSKIDLSNYQNGIYYLRIKTNKEYINKKIIIQK